MAKGEVMATDHSAEVERRWISNERARRIDDRWTTFAGRATGGMPLPRIAQAYMDWSLNVALSPGRQLQIVEDLARAPAGLARTLVRHAPEFTDPRFAAPEWQRRPFSWLAQMALARESRWTRATAPLPGMNRHNAALVQFYTRQMLEATSPANFPLTNPEVLKATRQQRGRNLARGARNLAIDTLASLRHKPARKSDFRVGQNLAATPGKVIHRNALMELIQYTPTTETVYAEPILYVPAWIMKYYILDLSAHNSMIRWLVEQGHTVFTISWKNPDAGDRDLSMDDYRRLGILEALDAIGVVMPKRKVHAVGYCVGGTLLSIVLAAMARDGDKRVKSATLFAAQTDFQDAGELKLFIDEMTLYWLDRQMVKQGFLATSQMGGAFGMLRSRDLIWSPAVRRYWLGESDANIDMMAWNADGTRMPHRMHIEYLRDLYLENKLAQGKYRIGGKTVSMGDVSLPMFVVGTSTDHVAPWKSVYKIRNLKRLGETTFALTNGGHNAGIVSQPGRPRRHYQLGSWDADTPYQSPDEWQQSAAKHEGSWWPAWEKWLAEQSGNRVAPPPVGNEAHGYGVLGDAPGTYVLQK
ncbi:MAG TPA: alpha/beta fold hydrolase [Nevskiaceae bacterium]|nr:alpha/beta fold hydrolase [Nevskiaceae bacterium]